MPAPFKVMFASHGSTLNGGAERSLLDLAVYLRRDRRVSPFVTVPGEGELERALTAEGVPTCVVDTPLWTPFESKPFDAPTPTGRALRRARVGARVVVSARRAWRGALQQIRPDVVVTNTVAIASPALAAASLRIPHVWWIHEFVGRGHHLEFPLGNAITIRLIDALSAQVVVNSEAVFKHYAPPIPASKVSLIHPTVVGSGISRSPRVSGELRLLMLGTLSAHKGVDRAIEAVALLQDLPGVSLRLVGWISDGYRRELEVLAERLAVADLVEFPGPTESPESELLEADVLLMCSHAEAFGRVTAEALKCGTPVVGFRSGGTPEIVTDGVDGLLVAPGDVAGLARALRSLAEDRPLLRRLGEQAQRRNSDRFTLDDAAQRMVLVLDKASRGRTPPTLWGRRRERC